jgi:hypothetical protein
MTVTSEGRSSQPLTMPGLGVGTTTGAPRSGSCDNGAPPSRGPGSQAGPFGSAFPNPMGAAPFLGIPQAQGFQQSIWPQPAYAWQTAYGLPMPTYGQQPWTPVQAGHNGSAPFRSAPFGSAPFGPAPFRQSAPRPSA